MNKEVVIICEPLRFYTENDEEFAFEWFKRMKPIKKVEVVGTQLFLYFESKKIAYMDVIEIMGIFDRYRFKNRDQLEVIKNKRNEILFNGWIKRKK